MSKLIIPEIRISPVANSSAVNDIAGRFSVKHEYPAYTPEKSGLSVVALRFKTESLTLFKMFVQGRNGFWLLT